MEQTSTSSPLHLSFRLIVCYCVSDILYLEFLVQELTHVGQQSVDEREAVVLP